MSTPRDIVAAPTIGTGTAALDHVGLSVGDLDAQSRWYAEALGLRQVTPFEIPPLRLRGVFLVHESGWALELLERAGSVGRAMPRDQAEALLTRGWGHVCVRVTDVDGAHAALLSNGATELMAPQAAPEAGVRMSFVADPEGNLVELIDRDGPAGR